MYQIFDETHVIYLPENMAITLPAAESYGYAYEKWLADGNTPEPADPPPQAAVVAAYTATLEAHYDATAQQRRYDNRLTCALRAGYPGPFQAEGIAFGSWMDEQNAYAYAQLDAVIAGQREQPTPEELVAELAPMVWP